MDKIHKLLKRQLAKYSINIDELPYNIKSFINDINITYNDFEEDKELLERSLEISSQELLEKNFELKAIFESIPEILFKTDKQGNILEYYYNKKNIKFYKKLSSNLYNKNITYLFPSKIKKRIIQILINITKSQTLFSLEFSTNSEKNFWEALFIPFLKEQVIIIIKDITNRKNIELELRKNEKKYKRIFEDIPVGLYQIDKNGQIIESNPFFAQLMGYNNPDEIIGKNINQFLYNENKNYLTLLPNFFSYFKSLEKKYKNINGDIIYTIENIKAIKDKTDCFEIVLEDITKLKNFEEKLSREKEKLSTILDNIEACVIVTDIEGNILFANKNISNIINLKSDDIINKKFFNILSFKKNNETINIQDIFKKIKEQKTIFKLPIDTYILDEKNNKKYIGGTFSPIISKNNTIIDIVIILRDITELKIAEKEHQKIEKLEAIGVLAGGIAHDFNNLLTIILGNLEFASLLTQNSSALEKLKIAEEATLKAKHLTNQLLTFSKGGAPIKKTADLKNIILDSAKFLLSGTNIKFSFSFDENLYPVDIDKGQIYQVFNNILINSIQAMPGGGEIFISAQMY